MIILEQVSKIQSMLIFVDYLYFSLYTKITNKANQISKKERAMKDLTKGKISKNLFFYSIPIILSYLLARTHTMIDKIMVGQLIGENGLSAIGSTSSFVTVVSSLFWSFGTGIALFIAYNIKRSEPKDLARQVKSGTLLVLGFGGVFSILAILLYSPIFSILSVVDKVYDDARLYYIVIFIGQAFLGLNCFAKEIFYYLGKPSNAFKISLIDCVGNIVLNYVMIKFFGLGVLGAAIATVIVLFISGFCNIYLISKETKSICSEKTSIRLGKDELIHIIKLSIPCILQQVILYLAAVIIQPTVNRLDAAAAYSVTTEIYNVCTIFFYGCSKAVGVYCTQCFGKKNGTILKGIVIGLVESLLLSSIFIIPMMIFPKFTANLFLNESGTQTATLVVRYINVCFPFIAFAILNNVMHNAFRGLLVPKFALFTTSIFMIAQVVSVLLLAPGLKMDGVYFGTVISWLVEGVACILLLVFILRKPKAVEEIRN